MALIRMVKYKSTLNPLGMKENFLVSGRKDEFSYGHVELEVPSLPLAVMFICY